MLLLGFIPGFGASYILKTLGLLRIPENVEISGMDIVKIPAIAYPEGMKTGGLAATPAE